MFEKIPQQLKDIPRWCNWQYEYAQGRAKPLKVPCDQSGHRVDITRSWSKYPQCLRAVVENGLNLGFIFANDGVFGIDIDSTNAMEWANYFGTYTELSPSGNGIHAIGIGTIPGKKRRRGTYEIYSDKRFFTMTGNRISTETELQTIELTEFYNLYIEPITLRTQQLHFKQPTPTGDISILHTPLVDDLLAGRWRLHFPSQSEAELSFFSTVLKCMSVPEAISLYKGSSLYRHKWEERRGNKTYGQITIERALQ